MPSEAQLKSQMKAAIARKKQSSSEKKSEVDTGRQKSDPKSTASKPAPKFLTAHPAIFQSTKINDGSSSDTKPKDDSVASEAELIRNFFGRPVRIGVFQQQIYFCVPDVLEISNSPDKQLKYTEFKEESVPKKIIDPLVITMWFSNLSGGNEKLEAAKTDDLITIIKELDIPFPGPIDKWLTETGNKLLSVLAR